MSFPHLLGQGGPVMYVLLGMSILACAIVLLKLWQFGASGLSRRAFIEPALRAASQDRPEEAVALLAAERSPVARVMAAAISAAADRGLDGADVEAEVGRVGSAEIRNLESGLRELSAIAHLSPLLGLLGTVFGMISAFMKLEEGGAHVDPAMLAGGIWEALLTTAFGLTVAIPAMAAFYLLEGQVDRVRAAMKDVSVRSLLRCGRRPSAQDLPAAAAESESYGV